MCLEGAKRGGFSLFEVVFALAILAMLAAGISQNLILTRGMAESNIREVTAHAAASGYIEQLKTLEYGVILESVADPAKPLPTVLSQGQPDPLTIGQWMTKEIVIDEDRQTGKKRWMTFHVRVEVDDLAGTETGEAVSIAVFFAWEEARTRHRQERALRTIRSRVPTF